MTDYMQVVNEIRDTVRDLPLGHTEQKFLLSLTARLKLAVEPLEYMLRGDLSTFTSKVAALSQPSAD